MLDRVVFLFAIILVIPFVSAQGSGVSAGHSARYDINGDLSEGVVRSDLTVISVVRSNVTVESVDTRSDGNRTTDTLWIDLATGQNNTKKFGVPGFFFVILPGIGKGASIYTGSSFLVQDTMTRDYAGASRQVNFANFTGQASGSTSYYWDVESGILTEALVMYRNSTGEPLRIGVHALIRDTNIWSPQPQNPLVFYLAVLGSLGGATVLVFLIIHFRSRGSRKTSK